MSRRFINNKNVWVFDPFLEEKIKRERKANLVSIIQAVDKHNIQFNIGEEKNSLLDKLKSGLHNLSQSPKIKTNVHSNDLQKGNLSNSIDDIFFDRGRKHYNQHPNFIDNVKSDAKHPPTSTYEGIENLVDYYTRVGEQERNYSFNPKMHSFYNKEKLDSLEKYNKKIRHIEISPDGPNNEKKDKEEYFVLKFNQNKSFETSANVIGSTSPKDMKKRINNIPTKIINGAKHFSNINNVKDKGVRIVKK